MRDLLVVAIVVIGAVIALRRPWIGVMLWTWISLMNPHRYTWGFAYDAPLAALAAASTLVGLLLTRERENPFKGPAPVILLLFMVWMTLSWLMGLDPAGDHWAWDRAMKIDLMILVALALLKTKAHIFALAWVCMLSLGILSAKGGLFTVLTAGNYRVWGPAFSFIADNNHFALATIMTIPLVRFLQLQLSNRWARASMTIVMILLAASALGSHSRGALLAIFAMALLLWWRSPNKLPGGIMIVLVGVVLVAFMPEHWTARMATIETFQEDRSAMQRISAWWVSWRIALDYPFGVGFTLARPDLFNLYSPYPDLGVVVAHSNYFQVMGHHGFVGLFLFLLLWVVTWFQAGRIRKVAANTPQARWCYDLAGMCQVSLAGYLVGGTFLDLAYFDLPYNLMVLVVLTDVWVRSRAWETERGQPVSRFRIPGVHTRAPAT